MTANGLVAQLAALPPRTKMLGAAFVGCVLLAVTIFATVGHSSRVPLFAMRLAPEQLAEVEERLAEWNVSFTPSQDNVLIDAARRNDTLLRLSLAGVPHAHVATTNEALASVGVLTPQSVIDAQARSGLAGEIELALRGIDGVDDAHVIIAPAKLAEFADQQGHDATASVRIRLHPGAYLSRASIQGLRSFVAASVPGLNSNAVTLLDDRGIALDAQTSADDAGSLQTSLQTALDETLGPGVALVRVRAEYSNVERQSQDVRRAALGVRPIAHHTTAESFDGTGKHYRHDDTEDDGGSDTATTIARTPSGTLARISTAVFIDSAHTVDLAAVRSLAEATVGYDQKRGDVLDVKAVDFHHARPPVRDLWFLLFSSLAPMLPALAIATGLIVSSRFALPHLMKAVRTLQDRAAVEQMSKDVAAFSPARVRAVLAKEPPHAAAAVISALPTATAAAVLELYPAHEREAIVARMQRAHAPIIHDIDEVFRNA